MAAKIGLKSFGTFVKQVPDSDEGLPLATSALLSFLRWKFKPYPIVGCQTFYIPLTRRLVGRGGVMDVCWMCLHPPPPMGCQGQTEKCFLPKWLCFSMINSLVMSNSFSSSKLLKVLHLQTGCSSQPISLYKFLFLQRQTSSILIMSA